MELIFEKSKPGRRGITLPKNDVPTVAVLDEKYRRKIDARLPEVAEHQTVRHFTALSKMNCGVDGNFYPLGSCTMKYNPKFCETAANFEGFRSIHPLRAQLTGGPIPVQGCLEVLYNLEQSLCRITGMDEFTCQPMAGAHGELTGIMLIAAYHKDRGKRKKYVLIPDSGHGTNPATAAIAGFEVKTIPSSDEGVMDPVAYKSALSEDVAALMLTCPNTLGIFNPRIREVCDLMHEAGGQVYYDGANLNAILGKVRPGDVGFDVVHVNVHKTFATPHGGGGPGAGPVGVREHLIPYLPISRVIKRNDGTFALDYDHPKSIGYISPFYGSFGVLLRAYSYILLLGREGLIEVAENAVLNANYLRAKLKDRFDVPYGNLCMHEFVISAVRQAEKGVGAIDIAKALIDEGIHPPTVHFPLIVKEALMIEPTETETKETLDRFVEMMIRIDERAEKAPEGFKDLPKTTPVTRLDEVKAARQPDLCLRVDMERA